MNKPKLYNMGLPKSPEENPESIYHYINACYLAGKRMLVFKARFRDFEKAKETATPEEMKLLRVAIQIVRTTLNDLDELTATPEEIAESIETLFDSVA